MKWNENIDDIQGGRIEKAKVECGRKQCELIQEQNEILKEIKELLKIK